MRSATTSPSLASDQPFKFVGGDLSLDFVNTADWTRRGPIQDRLTGYGRLLEWARAADVLPEGAAERLRARAVSSPGEEKKAFESARHSRGVLRQLFESIVAGKRSPEALARFNSLVDGVHQHLVLTWPRESTVRSVDAVGPALSWDWRGRNEQLESVLWPVVRAAATLLASDEACKLRICSGADCGWMYVDRSRNGFRRWCEMSECGTREKSRRRSERRQEAPALGRRRG
jgi:predicted RNA-binding Zn ribbon-like protein